LETVLNRQEFTQPQLLNTTLQLQQAIESLKSIGKDHIFQLNSLIKP